MPTAPGRSLFGGYDAAREPRADWELSDFRAGRKYGGHCVVLYAAL